jgi:hypothetical protein
MEKEGKEKKRGNGRKGGGRGEGRRDTKMTMSFSKAWQHPDTIAWVQALAGP